MKETLLDVLMYLFENYHDGEFSDSDNQETLRVELAAAGFPEEEVDHAFSWLDGLARQRNAPTLSGRTDALRIYAPQEQERLSAECRGFLLYLEQLGILNSESRELVIERLLALEEEVDLERVKWVCLLVLINQPGEEEAAVHLEDMVYYQGEFLH
jgi:Smg protein